MNRLFIALVFVATTAWAAKAPIPIADVQRTTPVDFDREVLPFLSDNCLACHCQTTTKGGLNLETPALMLKGGDGGPAIVPKKSGESLVLQAAAHLDDDLLMPPRDNKAKAKNLTPEQLGLLKLWIDQGAIASPKRERTVTWQPLSENLSAIFAVAVTGDGQFAACSRANRVFIYHLPSGRLVAEEAAHRDQVNALAFSPDGTLLATGGYREVKLWRRTKIDGKPAQPLAAVEAKTPQRSVKIEGNVVKLLGADGKVIAELRGNRLTRELAEERERALQIATGHVAYRKEAVAAAEKALQAAQERVKKSAEAIAPKQQELDAKQQAFADAQSAEAEQALKLAEAAREALGTELNLAKAEEKKFASSVGEAKATVDSAETSRQKMDAALQAAKQAATAVEQPIRAAAFSADGSTVATAGDDQLIHTWSAENGAAFDVLPGHKATITALAFAPNGELISTAADGATLAWNLKPEWKLERTIGTGDVGSPLTDRVNALAFSRDGKQLATGSGEPSRGGEIKLWDAPSGQLVRDFPKVHSDAVLTLEFSPDGKQLASGGADKMARILNLATGKTARNFEGHTHHILGVSWSADGRTLATAGADNVVKTWDTTTGERRKNIDGYDKEVTAVRFLATSTTLVTTSGDHKVRIVGVDGKEVRALPEVADFMHSATATADGKLIIAGGEDSVLRVWNAEDGKPLASFPPAKTAVTKN